MNREFDKAKLFFESGLKEIEKLNFDKTEEEFLQSLKIIPNRSSTMYHLVNIYIFKEKFDKLGLEDFKEFESEIVIEKNYKNLLLNLIKNKFVLKKPTFIRIEKV